MMTDPIADMLTRLRNGTQARKEIVEIPGSKLKLKIATILKEEGFVSDVKEVKADKKNILNVSLKYGPTRKGVIAGIRRVSRPGLRVYTDAENIPRVLNGLGVAIISTSKGLLTDKQCRKNQVGGEVLCYVW